jgi:hypothetical protein
MALADTYKKQVALLLRILPFVSKRSASPSKEAQRSIFSCATCRGSLSILI